MLKVLLNFELIKCYISSVLCPAELTYDMLFHNDGTVTKAGPAPDVGTPLHLVHAMPGPCPAEPGNGYFGYRSTSVPMQVKARYSITKIR